MKPWNITWLFFKETTMLKHLDLSKNLFGEVGGQLLGAAIGRSGRGSSVRGAGVL